MLQHVMSQVTTGIRWQPAYKTNPVSPGIKKDFPGSAVCPERLCSDVHLLHAQVPGWRGLTWAASDGRDRQAAEEEVHGGQEGLQKADRAESRASMGGKVDFIGVRAGWLEERLILTGRPGGKERVMRSLMCVNMHLERLRLTISITFRNQQDLLSCPFTTGIKM